MWIVVHIMTCRISRFQDGGSLNNYITIFLAEGIWKVHIFRHLFVCFQTSVYTLGEFHKNRNNSTVFEELSVSNPQLTPPTLQIEYCYSWSRNFTSLSSSINWGSSKSLVSVRYALQSLRKSISMWRAHHSNHTPISGHNNATFR